MPDTEKYLGPLEWLVAEATRRGASAADAVMVGGRAISASVRLGRPEKIERSEEEDIGLRVFKGTRQAIVSSSDRRRNALEDLLSRALAMAANVPEDPYAGIAEPGAVTTAVPDLDLADSTEPSADELADLARRAEDAARAIAGVTNSEGGEAGFGETTVALAASNGFRGTYRRTGYSLAASVLAGTGTGMERDYEFSSAVHLADLADPETVGRAAGERAVRRLGARKAGTAKVPLVFDRRVAGSLVGHLASAVNGRDVARGTSFLKDKMGETVFPADITIVDDPLRRRGLRSRPFDGEGLAGATRAIVENGRLKSWILDLRSARQLGLVSTGNASRGVSSPPSPSATNLYLEPGAISRRDLIVGIDRGFLVTEMMGFGVNGVTGDYSRGATGFWIENGEVAYPVSEVTVAGNLKEMFLHLTAANDLVFQFATNAPTVRIDGMTVAGK